MTVSSFCGVGLLGPGFSPWIEAQGAGLLGSQTAGLQTTGWQNTCPRWCRRRSVPAGRPNAAALARW